MTARNRPRIIAVEVSYLLENDALVHAALGGDWSQWGSTSRDLVATATLTHDLNNVVNEHLQDQAEQADD